MAWYLIVYLVLFVVVGIAGIVEDWRPRRPLALIAGMVVALFAGIVSVWAFTFPSPGRAWGAWLWPLLAFAVSMDVLSGVWDLRDLSRDNQTSRSGAVLIAVLVVAITLPAYVLGAVAAARSGS